MPTASGGGLGRHHVVLVASALLVTACGTTRFAREPQPVTDLAGHWALDRAASDDAQALIAASLPKPKPRPATPPAPEPLPQPGSPQGPQGRSGGSGSGGRHSAEGQTDSHVAPTESAPAWGRVRPADFVSAFAAPSPALEIEQRPGRVSIGSAAHRRDFDPGDEEPRSITDRYGSRRVSAGWQHDEFIVHSDDGGRLTVVEHYRRRGDDHLELVVEFSARGLKSLTVHSVYRRATAAELEAGDAEGPPPPAPH